MEPSDSYLGVLPDDVLTRYDFVETRNAARILQATNPEQLDDVIAVLRQFRLSADEDITPAGRNESATAARLNHAFRGLGWQEASYTVTITSQLVLRGGESPVRVVGAEQSAASYNVDNVKGRVALDVEWHAKDGNLDRDIAAYRSLYDSAIIDGAVMVTMTRESMRAWVLELDPSSTKFGTSTTTNLEKVRPRLVRGDAGGCPILVASICRRSI